MGRGFGEGVLGGGIAKGYEGDQDGFRNSWISVPRQYRLILKNHNP